MKSTPEMRRNNLCILIDEAGGRVAFTDRGQARDLKIEYGFVGQLVNESRGIGNSVARKLELIGNKPKNWLDHPYYKKWLDLNLITEDEIPDDNVLSDISGLLGVSGPKDDYKGNKQEEKKSISEKKLANHRNEIEQLINKIEFIFSKEDSVEDREIITKIVDLIFNKNQK